MRKPGKKIRTVSSAVTATLVALGLAEHGFCATYPTTVYSVTSTNGYDGNSFTSLTLGIDSTSSSLPTGTSTPNSIVNLDGSLLTGYAINAIWGYRELYTVNVNNLSASIVAINDSNHSITPSSPALNVVSSSGIIVANQSSADGAGSDVFTSSNGAAPVIIPLPTLVLGGAASASYSYTNSNSGMVDNNLTASAALDKPNGFSSSAVGAGGIVTGTISRYSGDANSNGFQGSATPLGTDGFYYNPSTGQTTAIGLSGTGYEYVPPSFFGLTNSALMSESTSVTGIAGANVAGYTLRYTSTGTALGDDGWIYTPSNKTTSQIGLTGSAYQTNTSSGVYEKTQVVQTNSAGQIAGQSYLNPSATQNPAVADIWLYTPSVTPGVASTFGTSSVGTYTQLGLTALPSGTTLGYTNPTNSGRYGNVEFLENNGHAAGSSNRYDASGTLQGLAAWYFNGTTNVDISPNALNPSDPVHLAASGGMIASNNSISAMNNTGLAAGFATRLAGTTTGSASLGQDAYVYDSNSGKEYFVDPADEANSSAYEYSFVGALSNSGYAVGFYNTYTGSTASTQTTSTIFVWSELGKLQPLTSFANTGTTANATLQGYVSSFQFGSDGELYAPSNSSNAASIVAYGLNVIWNNSLGTGNGSTWDTTSQNWTNGVIELVYLNSAMVTFNDNNNGRYAVTLNTAVSPNSVTFNNNAGNYTLSGSGTITGAGGLAKLGTGSVTLSTINTYTGATNVSGGSLILATLGALPSGTNLTIGTGASVVAENLGTRYAVTVGSLTVTGKLDLNNNGLIVHNGSIGAVNSLLQSGYNIGGWNGSTGIVSTTAANNASHLTALGVIINDTGANANASAGTPLYATFDGAPTTDGDILVKYTYYGDTNLDGKVDGTDYSRIDNASLANKTHPGQYTGWYNGDFNYDGVINGSDYTLIDNAFNTQGAAMSTEVASVTAQLADPAAAGSSVPEPGMLTMLAAGSTSLFCLRRRSRAGWKPSTRSA